MRKHPALLLLLLATLPIFSLRADTIILSGSISGEDDTLISGAAHNENFGGSPVIQLGENTISQDLRGLIRFDLSSLATDSIQSASLQVTLASTVGSFSNQIVYLYEVSQANNYWDTDPTDNGFPEAEANWDGPLGGSPPWAGSAGLSTAGVDYLFTPLAAITVSSGDAVGSTYTFTLSDTSFFSDWANNPGDNAGFFIYAPGLESVGAEVDFDSTVATTGAPDLFVNGAPIPEPGTIAHLLGGLGLFFAFKRRRS